MKEKLILIGLILSFFTSIFSVIPLGFSAETKSQQFRPFYPRYSEGTKYFDGIDGYPTLPTVDDNGITREWNIDAWDVESVRITIRWAFVAPWLFDEVKHTFDIFVNVSLDNGLTWTENFTIWGTIHTKPHGQWGLWDYVDQTYDMFPSQYYLLTPSTRMNFKVEIPFYTFRYIALVYWGAGQEPVPPHDWIDGDSNYIQYYILFDVKYKEKTIPYLGENVGYPDFPKTVKKMQSAGTMILNCMLPSGTTNEVVGIKFGRDSWVIIYSAQLGMMELLDLCSLNTTTPEERNNYLLAVTRFLSWMWSKQNVTDGSFPFILTDGDLHPWINATSGDYYGYDKIDSFSACSISLMKKYYDATLNGTYINSTWTQILKSKDFIYDCVNQTVWLPVDGYHYNGTVYTKSNYTWLHDACECYQGLKDLAWLYGNVKNNSTEQTYWNNFADSIASNIRSRMWNETLGRYCGGYNVLSETQDDVLVYNIITPVVYQIETNTTRARKTMQTYCAWGEMCGRYLDRTWAMDYSVYNEYSTMGGMMLSGFAELNRTYGYYNEWMYVKFDNITHFLFDNPLYPNDHGNLQNSKGILDYVNFVNETWAIEYARLIETSAWFIDGMMKLPYMTYFWEGEEGEIEPWWEHWEWWHGGVPPYPIKFILGMVGLASMAGGSLYAVQLIKRKEYYEGFRNGAICNAIGFAFFIAWLF
jgi:hypothetical protein